MLNTLNEEALSLVQWTSRSSGCQAAVKNVEEAKDMNEGFYRTGCGFSASACHRFVGANETDYGAASSATAQKRKKLQHSLPPRGDASGKQLNGLFRADEYIRYCLTEVFGGINIVKYLFTRRSE